MNPGPSHEEIQEMLPALAMEILDGPDLQRVSDHVRACESCTRLLAEYREVAATIPLLLPELPLDPDRSDALRARLLTRVREESRAGAPAAPSTAAMAPSGRPGSAIDRWTGWMGWLVAAGLAGLLLVHHSVHRPIAYGWLVAGVLTFLVIALGVYVRVQQARLAALRDRLAQEATEHPPRETARGSRA